VGREPGQAPVLDELDEPGAPGPPGPPPPGPPGVMTAKELSRCTSVLVPSDFVTVTSYPVPDMSVVTAPAVPLPTDVTAAGWALGAVGPGPGLLGARVGGRAGGREVRGGVRGGRRPGAGRRGGAGRRRAGRRARRDHRRDDRAGDGAGADQAECAGPTL